LKALGGWRVFRINVIALRIIFQRPKVPSVLKIYALGEVKVSFAKIFLSSMVCDK